MQRSHRRSGTPAHVAEVCGLDAKVVEEVGREIGKAGSAFASHVWRNTAAGNEGGWSTARNLQFVSVLVGAGGTIGGTAGSGTNKFVPSPFSKPRPQDVWSELLYPQEWPLAHHELSYLLPHLIKSGRGRVDTYFTRVYNPVWTNPDGAVWIEMLSDEQAFGCHVALTPTWNETARWADYVLPMGHATERHDLMSQETHAATWIGFRQPVHRVLAERQGKQVTWTYEVNPGQVWEEDEFWIALSWQVDPDGALGIRQHFESPYRKGERVTITEYYRWIFENSVPGLPEAAKKEGLSPLEYMQRHGCFLVQDQVYKTHESELKGEFTVDEARGVVLQHGKVAGVSGIYGGLFDKSAPDKSYRAWFVAGLIAAGALLWALAPGALSPAGAVSLPTALIGGLLVGFGARLGNGCTSGHGVCGLSRMSRRSLVATLTFMCTGALAVFLTRHVVGGAP